MEPNWVSAGWLMQGQDLVVDVVGDLLIRTFSKGLAAPRMFVALV